MTPLQGAMVAAAIANNGAQMRPYLIDTLQGPDLNRLGQRRRRGAAPAGLAAGGRPAARDDGQRGVQRHRHQRAIDGFEVGGKTGTAQNGDAPDHGWFIGYARKDGQPVVAVAVLLQNAGSGGSAEAAQIAGQVMRAAIAAKGTEVMGVEMISPGTMLGGRYRLEERIASGGMGDVWRCTDDVLGRTVAVKILLPSLLEEAGFTERFRGRGPHHGDHQPPGRGRHLRLRQRPDGRRVPGDGVRGGRRAVPYPGPGRPADPGPHDGAGRPGGRRPARRPREGRRAPRRQAGQPAGAARTARWCSPTSASPARPASAQLTAAGSVLGTASYISPEQAMGEQATRLSDVYALGVVAYQCLAGRRPFEGENPLEIAMRHVRETPPPLPPDIPPPVRAIVERAMAKDPAARWPTAAAFAAGRPARRRRAAPRPRRRGVRRPRRPPPMPPRARVRGAAPSPTPTPTPGRSARQVPVGPRVGAATAGVPRRPGHDAAARLPAGARCRRRSGRAPG